MDNKSMEDTMSRIDSMASGFPAQEAVLPSRGSTATRLPTIVR